MKTFKYLLLAAIVGAGFTSTVVRAQDEAPRAERKGRAPTPEAQVARIDKAVGGLTDDEKTKITAIVTNYQAKLKEAAQDDRRALMKAQHDEIRAVLTADQQAKFDAMPAPGRGGRGKKKAE